MKTLGFIVLSIILLAGLAGIACGWPLPARCRQLIQRPLNGQTSYTRPESTRPRPACMNSYRLKALPTLTCSLTWPAHTPRWENRAGR